MFKMRWQTVPFILLTMLACQSNPEMTELSGYSQDVLKILPKRTNLLVYLNLKSLHDSPFGEEIQRHLDEGIKDEDNEEYQDFVAATGVNLEKDIDELWLAGSADAKSETIGGAIVNGTFDGRRIKSYLQEHRESVETIKYKDREIHIFGDDDKGMLFWSDNTILFGDKQWLKSLIDRQDGHGSHLMENPVMATSIKALPYKRHLWGVFDLQNISAKWAEQIREKNLFKGSQSVENMETFVFAARLGEKADIYILGTFQNNEEAELLANMLNGFKALAKLMVSDDKEAIDMLNDIDIQAKGRDVRITTELQKDFIAKVQQKQRAFAGADSKLLF